MSSKNVKIFDETGCLSEDAMVEYAHGSLGIHLKKQVEIHINECDFCRDALEGISLMESKETSRAAIAFLNAKVANHGKPEPSGGKVILMNYWRMAAAVALFLVLGGGVLYVAVNPPFKQDTAAKNEDATGEENKDLAQNNFKADEAPVLESGNASTGTYSEVITEEQKNNIQDETVKESPAPLIMLEKSESTTTKGLADTKDKATDKQADVKINSNAAASKYPELDYSKMTSTGGYSNSPGYYSGSLGPAAGSAKPNADSVFLFRNGLAVDDAGNMEPRNTAMNDVEVVTATTLSKNKEESKKSDKQSDGKPADEIRLKAEADSKSKAESEKRAKEESARLSAEKKARSEAEAQASMASAEKKKAEQSASKYKDEDAYAQEEALKVADDKAEVAQARKDLEEKASNAETAKQQKESDKIFAFVEEMPEYPGGVEALKKYISQNIKYPAAAKEKGVSGTVYISYVVDAAGKVTAVKVWRGIDAQLDAEAARVISTVKGYKAGKQNGKPVSVQMTIPVRFENK